MPRRHVKSPSPSRSIPAPRDSFTFMVFAAAVAILVLGLAGTWGRSSLWGAHEYAFLPPYLGVAALLSLVGTLVWLHRRGAAGSVPLLDAAQSIFTPGASRALLIGTASFALFVVARIRHTLLGDGEVLVQSVTGDFHIHPLEPLTSVIQYGLFRLFQSLPHPTNWTPEQIAFEALACGSFVAGVAFVFTVRALARELVAHVAPEQRIGESWVALLLLAQGYIQIFFGYIENYAYVLVAIAWYFYASLAYLRGRVSSTLPAIVALVVACCLHLSAAALIPSALVLYAHALRSPAHRRGLMADLTATALVVGGFVALLFASSGQLIGDTLAGTVQGIGQQQWRWRDYAFSGIHLRDLLNELWLIGPLGAPLAIGFLVQRVRRVNGGHAGAFLLCALIPTLAVLWIADDSNLGYARNWDLLAMFGFVLAVAGVYFLIEWVPKAEARQRVMMAAIAISLVHTMAWVGLNTSEERSVERFAHLPLGLGRVESTLGAQFLHSGDLARSEQWLIRALDANPKNVRAHYFLGELYLRTGRPDLAVEAFQYATQLRPDRTDFRLGLVDALVRSARWSDSAGQLSRLIAETPSSDALWAARALLLARVGRWDQALESAQRSELLWEGHGPYKELQKAIEHHAAFPELMHQFWPEVSGIPWPQSGMLASAGGGGAHLGRRLWMTGGGCGRRRIY